MAGLRSSSLFWTFAGSFLAVLFGAAIVQGLVVMAIIRPLAINDVTREGELMIGEIAANLKALEGTDQEIANELRSVMSRHRTRDRTSPLITFVDAEGHRIPGRPPPGNRPGRPGRFGAGDRRVMDPSSMREVLRVPITSGGGRQGELVALIPPGRFPFLPPGGRQHFLLFIPVSIFLAGLAGLVLFRTFTRRIQSLEALAARVSQGDLEARVSVGRNDEIGRLGAGLNRMTERLALAKEEIEANASQRRQLFADISHELATPLTSIRGYTETILNPEVPVSDLEQAAYLGHILEEAKRMDYLINDILELTRLESSAIELKRERLDWVSLSANTVERFQARFADAGVMLKWIAPRAEAWIHADGRRLEQVLENLLMNALRYVPPGSSVSVGVSANGPNYRLTVADTGPGVSSDHLPHLFDRFYRADPSRSSSGTGLGLAIVKEIVLRHGGGVSAVPTEPTGLGLHIDLPGATG